ncbi:hypothetical protein KKC13_07570 [bacterium]|nr:hypothetical protein [bacterium]MBU1958230.1 hypothetical protein [bacterium]
MLIQFEENSTLCQKSVVIAIWVFAIIMMLILLSITYQEFISDRLTNEHYTISWQILGGLMLWAVIIRGLLLKSKISRWITLLFAYISLLIPFVSSIMFLIFVPEGNEIFFSLSTIPNIIITLLIIYILSNPVALKLYEIEKESPIKEHLTFIAISIFLIVMYIYFSTIRFL